MGSGTFQAGVAGLSELNAVEEGGTSHSAACESQDYRVTSRVRFFFLFLVDGMSFVAQYQPGKPGVLVTQ